MTGSEIRGLNARPVVPTDGTPVTATLTEAQEAAGTALKCIIPDARWLREEYLKNFEEYRQKLRRRCDDLRVDYVMLRTDESVDRALGVYLARRTLR